MTVIRIFHITCVFSFYALIFSLVGGTPSFGLDPPGSAAEHYLEGYEYLQAEQIIEAANEFETAFKIAPGDEKVHHSLGLVLLEKMPSPGLGRVIDLFAGLNDSQHSASSLYWLGKAYIEQGDYDKALEFLTRVKQKSKPNFKYVTLADVDTAIKEIPKSGINGFQNSWWVDLLKMTVIVAISLAVVIVLQKFVFDPSPEEPSSAAVAYTRNVFLLLIIALILVFGALAVGWIDGQQFVDLFDTIVNKLRSGDG